MTTVVLAGFFLMLFAPCVFAIYGGRDKKAKKAIAASYEDRAVNRTPEPAEADEKEEDFDIPVRREEFLMQTTPPAPDAPIAHPAAPVAAAPAVQTAVPASSFAHRMWHEEPQVTDLKSIVEQAESEALVAHAMAAQANAAALAATARAAQARAQAAAEHAAEANEPQQTMPPPCVKLNAMRPPASQQCPSCQNSQSLLPQRTGRAAQPSRYGDTDAMMTV